eukprot:6206494-Pleurochrysis_carterae.AAC.4
MQHQRAYACRLRLNARCRRCGPKAWDGCTRMKIVGLLGHIAPTCIPNLYFARQKWSEDAQRQTTRQARQGRRSWSLCRTGGCSRFLLWFIHLNCNTTANE